MSLTDFRIRKIEQRITVIEETIFKKVKRLRATEGQRFLIFFHLGLIKTINELPVSQNQKDLLVSLMLDIDPNNSKKFLSESAKKERPLLNTIANYTFLSDFFDKEGYNEIFNKVEKILASLKANKEAAN